MQRNLLAFEAKLIHDFVSTRDVLLTRVIIVEEFWQRTSFDGVNFAPFEPSAVRRPS